MPGRIGRAVAPALVAALALASIAVPAASAPSDRDRDGLPDGYERTRTRTDPARADTDLDGVRDGAEDADLDRLPNIWEYRLGLHPRHPDTDRDGIPDPNEDSDGEGLPNRWEIRDSTTDPRKADSDLDGIRDGAEDPDDDQLSNRGERRYRTDPHRADTDRDGTDDWHEDSNGDDVADGLTQDRRSIPAGLRPTLDRPNDRPFAWSACHQVQPEPGLKTCTAGRKDGRKVVVFGDSHALQWRGALELVASARGWRLIFMTKSTCPVADVESVHPSCEVWREAAMRRIAAIRPWAVVAAQYNGYQVPGATDDADNARLWREGLIRALTRLDGLAGTVVLLGETTWMGDDPMGCLAENQDDISACSVGRSKALGHQRNVNDRAAAEAAGVLYRPTHHLTCPYDPCPLILERTLIARDDIHITVRWVESVWRGLDRLLLKR
jgi:hypothetical protein